MPCNASPDRPPAAPRFALVRGDCAAGFEPVMAAMQENLAGGAEVGASFSLVIDGVAKVDIWGGHRDPARTLPWERDTIVCMRSVTKSVSATCILMLIDRGAIELEAPVARYWPGFGQAGKAGITVRQVLAQQAGLPYLDALAPGGGFWDMDEVRAAIEAQAPEWAPGSVPCYHSFSAGLIYQELMRQVDGRTIGRFLREEISAPFGIDFHIGLSEAENARCAQWIPTRGTPSWDGMKGVGASPMGRAWRALPADEDGNSANYRFKEYPSGNGHGNARAIARFYGALARGGELGGRRLLGTALIRQAATAQWDAVEAMTNRPFRYGIGYLMSCPPFPFGGHADNFGHVGTGGAFGFADPRRRLAMSYCGNRMAPVADAGPFATRLIDAAYNCL